MSAPSVEVAKAFSHELRGKILNLMSTGGFVDDTEAWSPSDIAEEFNEPLGNVSYHVKTLLELGMVELSSTQPRRGALEHYYVLTDKAREAMA